MEEENIHVLYIDDEEPNRILFQLTFRNEFQVVTAANGPEGLNILESHPEINIVISDMRMPGMDGLEFIKQARQRRNDVIYCLLTGYGSSQEIEEALSEQLVDYCFKKPFNRGEILDIVLAT